jgi:RNA polymerase sigma-70 factor (ECF subfamily)
MPYDPATRMETSSSAHADGAFAVAPEFAAVYRQHHAFVWRCVRRMGIPDGEVDDLVQEVFVVVHGRLAEFAGNARITTWLFGIAFRVISHHRRSAQARVRREAQVEPGRPPTEPDRRLSREQAVGILDDLLDRLDDDQRNVFIMAEVAKMSAPEIAELTGAKLNTVYSRLRLARRAFDDALQRWFDEHGGELPWMTS